MEAGWQACQADEMRSLRAGREADRADMEEEARLRAEKAARLAGYKKKKHRSTGTALLA